MKLLFVSSEFEMFRSDGWHGASGIGKKGTEKGSVPQRVHYDELRGRVFIVRKISFAFRMCRERRRGS